MRLVAGALLMALLAVSCSADSRKASSRAHEPSPTPNPTTESVVAFARCLQEEGIDVRDPEIDADGTIALWPDYEPNQVGRATERSCSKELRSIAYQPTPEQVAFMQRATKFVECMRANGIENMPDPTSQGLEIGPDIDPNTTVFRRAERRCSEAFN